MKLARVNSLLLVAILLINGYIILLPFLPGFLFWIQGHDSAQVQKFEAKLQPPATPEAIPSDNRLIIPSILFDQAINDGPTTATLEKGLWHLPGSSSPDKGGNTVIAGHRFTYANPRGALYNLDKVQVGNVVGVWWNKELYRYTVIMTEVVGPSDVSVEAPTTKPQLTIYTCTPLLLPKNRLVVIATPEVKYD